jgi:hypothetical protein
VLEPLGHVPDKKTTSKYIHNFIFNLVNINTIQARSTEYDTPFGMSYSYLARAREVIAAVLKLCSAVAENGSFSSSSL